MKWYVVSHYYNNGEVEAEILSECEIKNTEGYIRLDHYDRYVDCFDTLEECDEFIEGIKNC